MKNRPGGRCLGLPWLVATIAAVGSSAGEARAQIGNGACCFPNGSCDVRSVLSCTSAGGSFAGGATCAGVVCTGACCLPNGACAESTTSLACQGVSGAFRGRATVCADQVCGGACCDDNGACGISSETSCVAPKIFHGLGSACVDVDCAGACCTADGECIETSQNACEVDNGVFLGLEALCADAVCTGACCLPDKACIETGQGFCVQVLGSFQGRGSNCSDDCPTVMPMSFTYQGQLRNSGRPLSGLIDGRFSLWLSPESEDPANQIGFARVLESIDVVNGLFAADLDFGQDAFNGNARWLQIEVRSHDDQNPEPFTVLLPRQPLTPAPYALQTRGVVVLENGNVGIGTKSAQSALHVAGMSGPSGSLEPGVHLARDQSTGDAKIELVNLLGTPYIDFTNDGVSDFDARIRLTANDSLAIEGANVGIGPTNPANRLSVAGGNADFAGNVGVGTTSPQAKLDVRGDIRLGPSGQFRAASGEENLRIVRGIITAGGNLSGGTGFTVTLFAPGVYDITFTTPFPTRPTITVTPEPDKDGLSAITRDVTAGGARIVVFNPSRETTVAEPFHFIAIGPR